MSEIYFDNNGSCKPLPLVMDAVVRAMNENFGNPSSSHSYGDRARFALEEARQHVASLVGASPNTIHFAGSGSEANLLVFQALVRSRNLPKRLVISSVEHSSVFAAAEFAAENGFEVVTNPVDSDGKLDFGLLAKNLEEKTALVSVQLANNETGVIQDFRSIGELAKAAGALFHCDAAQGVGKFDVSAVLPFVDVLTFSGHKFHAPQGTGGLYWANTLRLHHPFPGAHQERGFRLGTENLPGFVGLGEAARVRFADLPAAIENMSRLRDLFEAELKIRIPAIVVNGGCSSRLCNTSNIRFEGINAEALMARMNEAGLYCSLGSACRSMLPSPSYVLMAMGLSSEEAFGSLRFSFSVTTTQEEVFAALAIIEHNWQILKSLSFL